MTVSNDISLHVGFMESINSTEDLMIHIRAKYNGGCNIYYEISAYPISCFFSWHIETELGHHHQARQKNMLCTVVMKVSVGNLMLFLYSTYINVYVSRRLLYHRHCWTISFGNIIPRREFITIFGVLYWFLFSACKICSIYAFLTISKLERKPSPYQ